jgi:hypothetical protein
MQDPSGREPSTSETVIVRPLDGDVSRSVVIGGGRDRADRDAATAETMVIRTVEEDGSSTVMIPADMIGLPYAGDEEDDEDDE